MSRATSQPSRIFPRTKTDLPRMAKIRLAFPRPQVTDISASMEAAVCRALHGKNVEGKRIGVTVLSRGLANYTALIKTLVAALKYRGAEVLLIPAIGCHGGGDAEGEIEVLHHLGITEETVGAPILTGLETRLLTKINGVEVYCSERALNDCDGLLVFGRVKEHTDINWQPFEALAPRFAWFPELAGRLGLRWGLESGLSKALAIGLAKLQAERLHCHNRGIGFGIAIEVAARYLLREPALNVLGGIAVVENGFLETALIEGVPLRSPDRFFRNERRLLDYSKTLLPKLPCGYYDLLHVNRIGKRFSGQGVHTKLVGRDPANPQRGKAWGPGMPAIDTLICSNLVGPNANGQGLFEFVTRRFAAASNRRRADLNALTAHLPLSAKSPIALPNDRTMLEVALNQSSVGRNGVRFASISDSMDLRTIYVSDALIPLMRRTRNVVEIGEMQEIPFDAEDNFAFDYS